MKPVYLHHFFHVKPLHTYPQQVLNDWLVVAHKKVVELEAHGEELLASNLRYMISDQAIGYRYTELGEINQDWPSHQVYRLMPESPLGVNIEKRGEHYQARALDVFAKFYDERSVSHHLIHVTCTGYLSPSAPQIYFASRNTAPSITHAYHMGCYAAMPAIRMAQALVQSETPTVDLAHTEMCSLHMEAGTHTAEQLIVQTLFADGHIVYRASEERPAGESFKILLIKEKLLPDSKQDMTWVPSALGMKMSLSKNVPQKIALALSDFIQGVCRDLNLDWDELKVQADFAIHPGGPKILTLAQDLLQIEDNQIRASKEILYERGNMSSATLPHIWQRLLESPSNKKYVLSLAFGPGLTMFGSVFERVRA